MYLAWHEQVKHKTALGTITSPLPSTQTRQLPVNIIALLPTNSGGCQRNSTAAGNCIATAKKSDATHFRHKPLRETIQSLLHLYAWQHPWMN
jgi:hypothetical protein